MRKSKKCRIAICGGIAVGKTTVGKCLSRNLTDCFFVEENPIQNCYLSDFYNDKKRWGFHSRIAMLALFVDYYNSANSCQSATIIFDRTVHELITFARLQFKLGNLTNSEYKVYKQLYGGILKLIEPLDIAIYLYCSPSVALKRIRKRGRAFEESVDKDYLTKINREYEIWIRSLPASFPFIKINTSLGVDYAELTGKVNLYLSDTSCFDKA